MTQPFEDWGSSHVPDRPIGWWKRDAPVRVKLTVAAIVAVLIVGLAVIWFWFGTIKTWDDQCRAEYGAGSRHASPTECTAPDTRPR